MQPPVALERISDTSQTRIALWQSGKFCNVPVTGLGTLGALAGLTPTDGGVIVGDGSTWGVESGSTARTSLGLSASDPSGFLAGQVIQEIIATRSTTDTTTSGSFSDTGLSASITPLRSDSVIQAIAIIPAADVSATGTGSLIQRLADFRIRNSTDGVNGVAHRFGRIVASSAAALTCRDSVWVHMRYTVNSTAARTFVLQFAVNNATDLQASTRAADSTITMILREIKQ